MIGFYGDDRSAWLVSERPCRGALLCWTVVRWFQSLRSLHAPATIGTPLRGYGRFSASGFGAPLPGRIAVLDGYPVVPVALLLALTGYHRDAPPGLRAIQRIRFRTASAGAHCCVDRLSGGSSRFAPCTHRLPSGRPSGAAGDSFRWAAILRGGLPRFRGNLRQRKSIRSNCIKIPEG